MGRRAVPLPGLDASLPATVGRAAVRWTWRLAPDAAGLAPTTVLVHAEGSRGKTTANRLAGDGRGGWFLAKVRRPSSSCLAPRPGADESPPPPTATPRPTPEPTPAAPEEGGFSITGVDGYTASIADLTLPAVAYSHGNQTSTGTLTLTAEDNQASPGAGWNVTIQTSALVYSGANGGTTIPAANLGLTGAATPQVVSGQAVDATNGPKVPSGLTLPATLDAARKVVQANAGYGQGTYTQALGVELTVPGMSRAGTYTATLTVTISAGP